MNFILFILGLCFLLGLATREVLRFNILARKSPGAYPKKRLKRRLFSFSIVFLATILFWFFGLPPKMPLVLAILLALGMLLIVHLLFKDLKETLRESKKEQRELALKMIEDFKKEVLPKD